MLRFAKFLHETNTTRRTQASEHFLCKKINGDLLFLELSRRYEFNRAYFRLGRIKRSNTLPAVIVIDRDSMTLEPGR